MGLSICQSVCQSDEGAMFAALGRQCDRRLGKQSAANVQRLWKLARAGSGAIPGQGVVAVTGTIHRVDDVVYRSQSREFAA